MEQTLKQAISLGRAAALTGKVATYIPELASADPSHVGIAAVTPQGTLHAEGESATPFSLQSISKVITLIMALMEAGEEAVFARVGMEPTGDAFNSIVRLETLPDHKPLNPFINAGAIAITDMVPGNSFEDRLARVLHFVRRLADNEAISINKKVAHSEWATGHRNRALAYFMKDAGVLKRGVEETLKLYFNQCAISMTCEDLARIGTRLAYPDGLIPRPVLRAALACMTTCGLYNGSGEFAVRVGMAGKSGVGGGILAITPGRAAVATFGPALDARGNSAAGLAMLGHLSDSLGLSQFDSYALNPALTR
ncbi:MAG: glutaminase [Symbiobacteriaceae bacterium]|jgi:glutaminase|nr:glutaminase [Symbiobacteriaceae bacterium]